MDMRIMKPMILIYRNRLAIAHNALPGQELQANYRDWVKKKYRATWAELDKVGRRLNEYGLCQIKIKRIMKT